MSDVVFNVGDRVVQKSKMVELSFGFPVGTGGVIYTIGAWGDFGIVFDEAATGGHDLGFEDVPYGRGLWVCEKDIAHEILNEPIDEIEADDFMEILK